MTTARGTWLAAVLALAGCGGARVDSRPSDPEHAARRVGGREALAIPRALEGEVAVTVWLDAGSLDAPQASVALVAAEAIAPSETEPIVLPDGTAFRRMCAADALEGCVHELAAAIADHDVQEDRVHAALERVRERRERGLGDARREAETLAAGAALGVELTPLGDVGDEVTTASVRAFLDAHYGDERSLWVAVGDVTASGWESVLSRQPSARASAGRGRRDGQAGGGVRSAERAEGERWALARRGSETDALALANAWSRRTALAPSLRVAAFPTRAGWIALVSGEGPARDTLARLRDAAPWPSEDRAGDEDAFEIAMRLGERWIAGDEEGAPSVGLAVVGPDADATASALASGGDAPWSRAEVAPIEGADALAIAWALPGPAADGAEALGASIVASEIFAHRCVVDGRVTATPEAIVVTRSASAPLALAEASLWTDCIALARPTVLEVETARRALVARVDEGAERRTIAARAIAADAPGLVAVRPSRDVLSSVAPSDVIARWRSWRDGGRWGMAGAPDALRRFVAEPGTDRAPAPTAVASAPIERARTRATAEVDELLLVTSLSSCGSSAHAAALLDAWRRELSAEGATIAWSESGASRSLAWAAVSIRGDEGLLSRLEQRAPGAAILEASRRDGEIRARRERAVLAAPTPLAARMAEGSPVASCASVPTVRSVRIEPFPTGRR